MKIAQQAFVLQWLAVSIATAFRPAPVRALRQIIPSAREAGSILKYNIGTECIADVDTKRVDSSLQPQLTAITNVNQPKIQCRRPLGSMELFMLPRPIGTSHSNRQQRPPMNHICAVVLSSTPSVAALRLALDSAVRAHPLLRARIVGDGYPRTWLDPFRRMVRWGGEENPLQFVVHAVDHDDGEIYKKHVLENSDDDSEAATFENPGYWGGSLSIVNVPGSTRSDLDNSWQKKFQRDLDSETVVSVVGNENTNHLWNVELHRLSSDDNNTQQPCALIITLNHCISDQGSLNMVIDQLIADIAELESLDNHDKSIRHPAAEQSLPVHLCESLLGQDAVITNFSTLLQSIFSTAYEKLRKYALAKVKDSLQPIALLPKGISSCNDGTGGGIVTPASILLFGRPLNGSRDISNVRSNVQYRWLPPDITAALVKKSKSRRVPISMTLAAAVATTCTDCFNPDGKAADGQEQRVYKILQSLDTRRFSGATESGDTLSCQAGAMDLCLGPLPDFLGEKLRQHSASSVEQFWKVAKQSFDQTSSYLKKGDAIEAVRLFDVGMAISDIGRLVESYASSSSSMGRAWSAGITNAGEYERQHAVVREGLPERGQLKRSHGKYEVHEIYYATSHARTGCTFPVGCLSVGGGMSFSFNPPWPLISEAESKKFADDFIELLRVIAMDEDT